MKPKNMIRLRKVQVKWSTIQFDDFVLLFSLFNVPDNKCYKAKWHMFFFTHIWLLVCAGMCTYHHTHQMEKTVEWAKGGVKKGIKPLWPLPGFSGQMKIKSQMSQNVCNSGCTIWICGDIKTCLVYFVLCENYFHWSCGTWIKMRLWHWCFLMIINCRSSASNFIKKRFWHMCIPDFFFIIKNVFLQNTFNDWELLIRNDFNFI